MNNFCFKFGHSNENLKPLKVFKYAPIELFINDDSNANLLQNSIYQLSLRTRANLNFSTSLCELLQPISSTET